MNMKTTFNGWNNVNELSFNNVVNLVLTNGNPDNLPTDDWLLDIIKNNITGEKLNILDFGVGIGRNIFNFVNKFPSWNFTGYDNENMLEFTKQYCNKKFNSNTSDFNNIILTSDWDLISQKKYDCIYSTLVFQHIYEETLSMYIDSIKKMTDLLIVSGRRLNDDDNKNTWEILENNGLYPINAEEINYQVNGDPHEHITCIYNLR